MSNGLRPTAEFYLLVRVSFNLFNHALHSRENVTSLISLGLKPGFNAAKQKLYAT